MPTPNVKSVRIFTTTWCAFCRAEKKFLDSRGVKYESVDVETNESAAAEMIKVSGQMGVPFTIITKADDTKVGILGFDQPRLSAELGLS
jgi:NADH-dependent peroxiredoxin subunit F